MNGKIRQRYRQGNRVGFDAWQRITRQAVQQDGRQAVYHDQEHFVMRKTAQGGQCNNQSAPDRFTKGMVGAISSDDV